MTVTEPTTSRVPLGANPALLPGLAIPQLEELRERQRKLIERHDALTAALTSHDPAVDLGDIYAELKEVRTALMDFDREVKDTALRQAEDWQVAAQTAWEEWAALTSQPGSTDQVAD